MWKSSKAQPHCSQKKSKGGASLDEVLWVKNQTKVIRVFLKISHFRFLFPSWHVQWSENELLGWCSVSIFLFLIYYLFKLYLLSFLLKFLFDNHILFANVIFVLWLFSLHVILSLFFFCLIIFSNHFENTKQNFKIIFVPESFLYIPGLAVWFLYLSLSHATVLFFFSWVGTWWSVCIEEWKTWLTTGWAQVSVSPEWGLTGGLPLQESWRSHKHQTCHTLGIP